MTKQFIYGIFIAVLAVLTTACAKFYPKMNAPDAALCAPGSLSQSQTAIFATGNDEFFRTRTADEGIGPYFTSTGCANCHSSDNRGFPSTLLTRFGQTDSTGNKFLNQGGPQLGIFALPGLTPCIIPPGATSTKFIAPITAGVGLLELVSDSSILAMAAANVNNPDGVRGHPNWNTIPSYVTPFPNDIIQNGKYICRFGRKGSTYNLLQQCAQAYNHDMGITSTFLPYQPYNYLDNTAPEAPSTPEVSNTLLNAVVFYVQGLSPPIPRPSTATTTQGKNVFISIGCVACHVQSLTTGYSPISADSCVTFCAWTDLLVHDMGPSLDDGYTEGSAKTSEWRTTPLWGLGLAPSAQGGQYYLLHDGRAHSIEQAITMHGGEATKSVSRFNNLSDDDRNALITFLQSL